MTISYLQPKDGPVLPGLTTKEVVYAKHQPEYNPLRTLITRDEKRAVLSRWSPTDEQRKAIAEGKDIFLQLLTFGQPLQPIIMYVAGDEDVVEIKDTLWPRSFLVAKIPDGTDLTKPFDVPVIVETSLEELERKSVEELLGVKA